MADLTKIVVAAVVAYVAYELFLKDSPLVKNVGTLRFGGDGTAATGTNGTAMLSMPPKVTQNGQIQDVPRDEMYQNNTNVLPYPQISNNFSTQGNFESSPQSTFAKLDCFPKDQLVPSDLLPNEERGFAESNPAPQGTLSNRNYFESGYHGGLNTQSGSLKNGNRQLRSDPLIPRRDVGPWSQSTYEPDTNRREFEIGGI